MNFQSMLLGLYVENIYRYIQKQHRTNISEYVFRADFIIFVYTILIFNKLYCYFNIHY